ncbi:MAG: DUF3857 domain-containing protein [Nitrosomonadales bacterium]
MRNIVWLLSCFVLVFNCPLSQALDQSQSINSSKKPTETKKAKSGDPGFAIEPTPLWTLPAPADEAVQIQHAPMHNELLDEQDKVDAQGVASYHRIVCVVDEVDGLSPAAEINIVFDPTYQTLVFHKIEIWRDGKRIDKLDRSKVHMLHRESNLEYQIYDGTITASLILDDVRVGDRVDYAYSVRGMNPVFDGKYVRTEWLVSSKGPTKIARFRLLTPDSRHILHRIGTDTTISETVHDGMRDTLFTRTSVPQIHGDQYTSESVFLNEQVNLSEFADWRAVSDWGERLFSTNANTPSPLVIKTAESIGATTASPPLERVRLALNFVQKEVRYFGTEMGESSHRPSSPDSVINQRFGDCKDKALLLISLLKELGINAAPVLVSTQYRNDIDPDFPSPLDFNHVITRVEIDGTVYWLDGTRAEQTGPLAQRQSVGLGKGLELRAGTTGLSELPGTDAEERISVEENYQIKAFSEPPDLELRMTYFGEMAEYLRVLIAGQPIETFETKLNADFARIHPNIKKSAPLKIEEVPDQNAIRIVQNFTVPKLWRFPEETKLVGDFALWGLYDPLRHTDEASRQQAFKINSPGIYRHTINIEFPEDVTKTGATKQDHEEDDHLYFQSDINIEPRKFQLIGELRLLKDKVTPTDWPNYTDLVRKIQLQLGRTFTVPAMSFARADKMRSDVNVMMESWKSIFTRDKPITAVQTTARIKNMVLTAELEGDRLNPELRAQAYRARGVQLDNMGFPEKARMDFEEALKLSPNDASILNDAAVNSFTLGQDASAQEYAKKSLALAPSDHSPMKTLAWSLYFGKNYLDAKQNLLTLLKSRSEINEGYSTIWLYLVARHTDGDAASIVKPYLAKNQTEWPHPLLQYLLGSGTFEQALEAAKKDQKDPSRLCELYYYTGEKYLIDGQIDQARDSFKKSIDTGVVEFVENTFSKRSLQTLDRL